MYSLIHLSSHPFPVTRAFYGQTFTIGALLRHANCSSESDIFRSEIWCSSRSVPVEDSYYRRVAEYIVSQQMGAHLKYDYENDGVPTEEFVKNLEKLVENGSTPVVINHYPIGKKSVGFFYNLDKWRKERGISNVYLVSYLNTLSNIYPNKVLSESVNVLRESCDLFFGVSEAVAKDFSEKLARDVHVILNGINLDMYVVGSESERKKLRSEINLRDDLEKVVCFSGRLSSEKGASILLETLQLFEKSTDPSMEKVGFVIASSFFVEGKYTPRILKNFIELKRLINEDRLKFVLDISKYIRGCDYLTEEYHYLLTKILSVSEEEVKERYGKMFGGYINWPVQRIADIAVQPSTSEAFGLVIVESIASGAYVLANDVGGIREIVSDESCGKLFKINHPVGVKESCRLGKEYADAIVNYERKPGMGRAYTNAYLSKFSDHEMASNFIRSIKKYINSKNSKDNCCVKEVPNGQALHL